MSQANSHPDPQDLGIDPNDPESQSESGPSDLSSPTAIRQMVLNYLIHHCYIETATAFANDGVHLNTVEQFGYSDSTFNPSSTKFSQSPSLTRTDSSRQTEMEVDNLLSLDPQRTLAADKQSIGELSSAEIHSVKTRRDVRDHILNGRIRQAIDLLNSHFPLVLNDSPSSNPQTSAPGRSSKSQSTSCSKHTPGTGISSSSGGSGSKSSSERQSQEQTERTLPANPTSLEPSHLFLNLQIQAFIESVRNASNSQPNGSGGGGGGATGSSTMNGHPVASGSAHGNSISSPLPSLAATTPGIASSGYGNSSSRSSSPAPSSAASSTGSTNHSSSHPTGSGSGLNPSVFSSLSLAQALFTNVQKLRSYWRAMYLKELENVTALLAYVDLEKSPVRRYLDQHRRVALAEQINSAIMCEYCERDMEINQKSRIIKRTGEVLEVLRSHSL